MIRKKKPKRKIRRINLNDSWLCECGKVQRSSSYLAAHWDIELVHTCKECGNKNMLLKGNIIPI